MPACEYAVKFSLFSALILTEPFSHHVGIETANLECRLYIALTPALPCWQWSLFPGIREKRPLLAHVATCKKGLISLYVLILP